MNTHHYNRHRDDFSWESKAKNESFKDRFSLISAKFMNCGKDQGKVYKDTSFNAVLSRTGRNHLETSAVVSYYAFLQLMNEVKTERMGKVKANSFCKQNQLHC